METIKDKKEDVSEKVRINSIIRPIFSKALNIPCEQLTNSMTTPSKSFSYLWRPNNYRRQIEIKQPSNSTLQEIKVLLGVFPMELSFTEHTKIISIKNYQPNITIQVYKSHLAAIYSQKVDGEKQVYHIERATIMEIEQRINEIKQNIKERLDNALSEFSRKFGLVLPFKTAIWSRHEDWVKGEEYIDKLPRHLIIHDTVFKKVYGEGIEFIGGLNKEPTASLKNYIKNRAIEDISPQITDSLNIIYASIKDLLTPAIKELTIQINTHLAVQNAQLRNQRIMNKSLRLLNQRLSQQDLRKWL